MTERPFRFGILAGYAPDVASLTALARRAEDLGYGTLVAPDPMGGHDAMTALSAVAAVTTELRLGTFVLAVSSRDTELLAWQARTLHALSGGRFELGLGLGNPDAAQRIAQLGREFGSAGQRLTQLADVIAAVQRHDDRPKLLLAGAGPKLLDLAGRAADIVSLTWRPQTTEAEADAVIARFRDAAGDRADDIELNLNLIAIGDQPAPWVERYIGTTTKALAQSGAVTVLTGTPERNADTLRRWRDRWGTSYVMVNARFIEQFAPVVAALRGT